MSEHKVAIPPYSFSVDSVGSERQLSDIERNLIAAVEEFEKMCRDEHLLQTEIKTKYSVILRVHIPSLTLLMPRIGQSDRDKEIYTNLLRLLERAKTMYEGRLEVPKMETDSDNERLLKKALINQKIAEIEKNIEFNDIHRIVFELMKILHWPTDQVVTEIEYTGYEDIKNDLYVIELISKIVNSNPSFFDHHGTKNIWQSKFKNIDLFTVVFQVVLRHAQRKKK